MGRFPREQVLEKIQQVKHWYHRIEVYPGLFTPGINDSQGTLKELDIPSNCSGLRVLDIGSRDGFFAFEFEKRGADVVAIDYLDKEQSGFRVAAELLGSKVTFYHDNIYNINKEKYGTFDIVLCLGLIYHLRDPMLALDICRSVCTNWLYLETFVIDQAFLLPDGKFVSIESVAPVLKDIPMMQFYPGSILNNDFTNVFGPNMLCMEKMLVECNFQVVEKKQYGNRATFKCTIAQDQTIDYFRGISRGVVGG